ncbi:MAG: DUF6438 domain-containing protein [Bacteroidales bacterium]|nr:DUF6438 domain-containing protein [Bacteroidales bacterium]
MKYSRILLVLIFLTGCSVTQQTQNANVVISVQKLPCLGNCPVYKVSIYSNQLVIYEGKENVSKTGVYAMKLDKQKFTELQLAFLQSGFFEMEDVYSAQIMDLQTTYLYFNYDGKEKKILDYYNSPEVLKDLVKMIEDLNELYEWEKVDKK